MTPGTGLSAIFARRERLAHRLPFGPPGAPAPRREEASSGIGTACAAIRNHLMEFLVHRSKAFD